MNAVMPQAVADRIFAFMALEKYGRIELDFQAGRLMSVKVVEHIRIGAGERSAANGLDDSDSVVHDSET